MQPNRPIADSSRSRTIAPWSAGLAVVLLALTSGCAPSDVGSRAGKATKSGYGSIGGSDDDGLDAHFTKKKKRKSSNDDDDETRLRFNPRVDALAGAGAARLAGATTSHDRALA